METKPLFLCLLLFVGTAAAGTTTRGSSSDCVGENATYRDWIFNNAVPKALSYLGQLMETNFELILPAANASKWDTYCRELGNIRSCVDSSTDTAEEKRRALAVIDKASPIVCDAGIKTSFPCLLNVSRHPTEQCQTRCQSFKGTLMNGINEFADNDTVSMPTLRATCQYVDCRVNCRKNDIIAQCENAGFEAAKKLMRSVAALAQTIHKELKDAGKLTSPSQEIYPEECTPGRVIN